MKFTTFNNCRRSKVTVTPANWRTQKASLKSPWRISYRFYDPVYKDSRLWGKQILIKGMNDYPTLAERQDATQTLLDLELDKLDSKGFNPVTGKYMAPAAVPVVEKLTGQTPFIRALQLAIPYSTAAKESKDLMWTTWRIVSQAAERLKIQDLPIQEVNRGMLMDMLEDCRHSTKLSPRKKDTGKRIPIEWNDNQFNFLRAHLGMMYKVLDKREALPYNPVHKIPKREKLSEEAGDNTGKLLTMQERRIIIDELQPLPEFLRFIEIFFPSGGRLAELCRVKGKHVDLVNQRYRVLVKKRQKMVWDWKTITNIALPHWKELMASCEAEDHVFSLNLMPGAQKIHPGYLTRRWKRHVKDKHGIIPGLYDLKHLFDSEVIDQVTAFNIARKMAVQTLAAHNSHTSTEMVDKVYDANKKQREHEFRKTLGRPFSR